MSRTHIANTVGRTAGLLCVAALWASGCKAPAATERAATLAPLTTSGMLTVPHDVGHVKLFNPITPYTIAAHAPQVEYAPYPVSVRGRLDPLGHRLPAL